MSSFNITAKSKVQDELKESMRKEINLMREFLSNLFQEESSLLQHDQNFRNYLIQDRVSMIEKLKCFRRDREIATKQLTELSPKNEKSAPIFEVFFSNEETICEITLLLDQLIALTDKINDQTARNQNLSAQLQYLVAIPHALPYPTHNKKHTLTTISREETQIGS